jgi:hypothetical protein
MDVCLGPKASSNPRGNWRMIGSVAIDSSHHDFLDSVGLNAPRSGAIDLAKRFLGKRVTILPSVGGRSPRCVGNGKLPCAAYRAIGPPQLDVTHIVR